MEIFIIITVIAALVTLAIYLKKKKKSKFQDTFTRVQKITDIRTSPRGVTLMVEDSASSPTSQEIEAIEEGLIRCFAKALTQNYDRPLNLSDYKVAILGDSIRSPESQTWCYKLPVGPYAGSEWDLGGYILAAGETVAIGNPHGNIIALPDHHGTDLEQLSTVTEYEAEHVILAHCDTEKFEATKVHGQGQGHPLF